MFLEFSLEARSRLAEVIHGYIPVRGLTHAGQLYPPLKMNRLAFQSTCQYFMSLVGII